MVTIRRSYLPVVVLCLAAVPALAAGKNDFDTRWTEAQRNVKSADGPQCRDRAREGGPGALYPGTAGNEALKMFRRPREAGYLLATPIRAFLDSGDDQVHRGALSARAWPTATAS